MLPFQKPTLSDRTWIQDIYECSGFRGAEYTFANLYLWSYYYGEVCRYGGMLCQRLDFDGVHQYIYPAGCGDVKPVLELLWQDSHAHGHPFVVRSLTRETMSIMENLFPGRFAYEEDRSSFDYLYEIETLSELKGKKYQAKRNHINRFMESWPNWYVEQISADNMEVCRRVMESWCSSHDAEGDRRAMEKAFDHYDALEFEGIVLFAEQEYPVGFAMGNRISPDTFDVNFEKAFADVQGAYPMVNREFARLIHQWHPEIRFLNREDDMGIEGLRKAKESYHPIFLEKFIAREIV